MILFLEDKWVQLHVIYLHLDGYTLSFHRTTIIKHLNYGKAETVKILICTLQA